MTDRRPASSREQAGVAQIKNKRNRRPPASSLQKLGGVALLAFWSSDLFESHDKFNEVQPGKNVTASPADEKDNLFLLGELSRDTQKWLLATDPFDASKASNESLVTEAYGLMGVYASYVDSIPTFQVIQNVLEEFSEFSVDGANYKIEVSTVGLQNIAPSDLYLSSLMEPTLASTEVKTSEQPAPSVQSAQPSLDINASTNSQSEFELTDEALYEESQENLAIEPVDVEYLTYGGFAVSGALLGGGAAAGGLGGLLASASGLSGRVIDGYVSGATVFSDLNDNAVLDWTDVNQNGQWDSGEGEVWALTDASGLYTFNSLANASGPIVSLGGMDVTTGSAITVLKAVAGSSIVTPVSTVFAFAEANNPGSGKDFLQAMGLTAQDLLYDPTLGGNANATAVLKSGASLLVMVNNAASVATAASGASESTAAIKVFSEIAKLSAAQVGGLVGGDATQAQAQLTAVMTSAVAGLGADPTALASTITAASKATAAVTAAITNLSTDAIRAGELLQYAQAGQQSLAAEIKALATSAAAGEDVSALVSKWSGDNAAASIAELKSRAATKLAFNTQDPNNPITTIADVFYVSAPKTSEGSTSPHTEKFSPLKNDLVKGAGELSLVAVGLLDTKAFVGSTLKPISASALSLGSSAKEGVDYTNMTLTLATAKGPQSFQISQYNVGTKVAQLSSALGEDIMAASKNGEISIDYLVSKTLPPNLKLGIDGNQLVVSNAFDPAYQLGSYDLIYVAQDQKSGASKTGLITLNVEPQSPVITRASSQTISVSEANDSPSATVGATPLMISGEQKFFTKVALPISVTGISPDGAFIAKGLPTGSVLTVKVADSSKLIEMSGTANAPVWAIRGADAFAADYSTLEIYIPSNTAGSFTPEFQATARYAGWASSTTASIAIQVTPTADGLNIPNSAVAGVAAWVSDVAPAQVSEGVASFGLNSQGQALQNLLKVFNERLIDAGSEKLAVRLTLPQNFQLASSSEFANLRVVSTGQPVTIEVFDTAAYSIGSTLSALRFVAPQYLSGDEFVIDLKVGGYEATTANSLPNSSGINWYSEPFQMAFAIAPVANGLSFTPDVASQIQGALANVLMVNGVEDQPHSLSLEKIKTLLTQAYRGLNDKDGSEQLVVKISLPTGFSLVEETGAPFSEEIYADSLEQLAAKISALKILCPLDFSGNVPVSFAFASAELGSNGLPLAKSAFTDAYVSTWQVSAQSDVPLIASELLTAPADGQTWLQTNHRLPDGRYQVDLNVHPLSTDTDGSEAIYTDILHGSLLYANATLDTTRSFAATLLTQQDDQGVSVTFTSKLLGANTLDLTKSGTGVAYLESMAVQPTQAKTYLVTFQNLGGGKSVSIGGATFVAGSAGASANEVAKYFSQQKLTDWSISKVQTAWDRLPGDVESVSVLYPASTVAPATISMRSVSVDTGAVEAYSDLYALTVPFVEKPMAPTLTLMTGVNGNEDAGIVLSDLIKVESGLGRSLDSVKVFIDLPSTFKLVDSSNQSVQKNSNDPRASYAVNANDLSKVSVLADSPNYVSGLLVKAFARDVASASNAYEDSGISERSVQIRPIADGFGVQTLISDSDTGGKDLPLALKIGATTTLYDPAANINLFKGVLPARLDSQEGVGVRLVFKSTGADAVSMSCAGKFITPTVRTSAEGTDLVFSLNQAQITGTDPITLLARETALGKQMSLEAFTLQGGMQSAVASQTVVYQSIIEAISPNVSVGSAVGLEDTAIAIPVKVPVSVDRSAFERTGVKFTIDIANSINTNSATTTIQELQKGTFKINGSSAEFAYDTAQSCWLVYQPINQPQLDLSKIVFVPPTNFSGVIGLIGTPFSIATGSSIPALGVPSPFKIYVDAVADPVTLVSSVSQINGVEDTTTPIDFSQYVDARSLSDTNEWITFEVQISSQLSLLKSANPLVPVSVSNDVSRYVLSTSIANFRDYFLDAKGQTLFSIKPTTNFSSQGLGTVAGADQIRLSVTTSESNGSVSTAANLNIPLKIAAVSDTPPAPVVLKSAAVIVESQESAAPSSLTKLSDVISVKDALPVDPSEKLSVVITTSSKIELLIGQKILAPVQVQGATANYVVSLQEYAQLFVKGKSFESSDSTISVRLRSTDFDGTTPVPFADSVDKTIALSIKPVASGFSKDAIFQDQVSTPEDSRGVLLSELVKDSAVARDSSESVVYRLSLPANVKLVGINPDVQLPTARLVADQMTYEISSEMMNRYQLSPLANFSGNLGVSLTAIARESDGSSVVGLSKVVTYSVAPVSDAPTLLTPTSVAGLISQGNPSLDMPIYVRTTDPSESLEVDLYLHSAQSTQSLRFTLSDGTQLAPSQASAGSPGEWVVHISSDKVALLPSLKVSASMDYRAENSIDVHVIARSQDGSAVPAETSNTFSLDVYQPLPSLSLAVNAVIPGQSIEVLPMDLDFAGALPNGVGVGNLSVMLIGAPRGAAFYYYDPTKLQTIPIGASLRSGQDSNEPVIWIFKGSDLVVEENGAWVNRKILVANDEFSSTTVTMQAFMTDPLSGAKSQSAAVSATLEFKDTGVDWTQSADPLVLSVDGSAITSVAPTTELAFELNTQSAGVEYATAWLSGTLGTHPSGYAFLVRPNAPLSNGGVLTLDDLYATFDDLVISTTGDSTIDISAEKLNGVGLWFDANTDGLLQSIEYRLLTELYPNINIQLPTLVAREAVSGLVSSIDEAVVDLGNSQSASLFAVDIPYTVKTAAATSLTATLTKFVEPPNATLQFLDENGSPTEHLPEDVNTGPRFSISLTKAQTNTADGEPIHLIKVYGLSDDFSLSQGVKIHPNNGSSFWILTQDAISSPIRVLGVPDHYVGEIALSVEAYASLVTGSGLTMRNISSKQENPSAEVIVTIEGVADTPVLEVHESAVTINEGGVLSFADHPLVSLSSPDISEDLFVRFHLNADPSHYTVWVNSTPLEPQTDEGRSIYEVKYEDLPNVSVTFEPFYADSTELSMWGVSRQGESIATSAVQSHVNVSFTPIADGVTNLMVEITDASAQNVSSTRSISEGELLNVHVQATRVDPNEKIQFALLMEGDELAINSVRASAGLHELSWETQDALTQYLASQWEIVDTEFAKRVFVIENAEADLGLYDISATFGFKLDPYLNDLLHIRTAAISVDPVHGVSSHYKDAISSEQIISIDPIIDPRALTAVIRDVNHTAVLNQLTLKEGGASDWFVVDTASTDSGERISVTLNLPQASNLELQTKGDQYRLVALAQQQTSTDVELAISLNVSEGSIALDIPNVLTVPVEVVKAVTTPALNLTGYELNADGKLVISIDDRSASGVLQNIIPAVTPDSLTDDVTTYVVSGVPSWLVPSVGKLIEKNDISNLSTYSFESEEIAGLTWTTAKSRITTDDVTEIQLVALNTEPTTLEKASSDAISISLTRHSLAETPFVLGPKEIQIAEGGAPIQLSTYSVGIVGFSEEEVLATVQVEVKLPAGLSLFVANQTTAVAEGPNTYLLSLDDFHFASVATTDINGVGVFDLEITARQTVGSSTADSLPVMSAVNVSNIPEDVVLSLLDGSQGLVQFIDEGNDWVLPPISVTAQAPGEKTVLTISLNSQFEVWQLQSSDAWSILEPSSIENGQNAFEVSPQDLLNRSIKISVPDRAQLGTFEVHVKAQSIDTATGLVCTPDELTISLDVKPHADAPVIGEINAYVLMEDSGLLTAPAVLSVSSPDSREQVELRAVLEGPDGQPLNNASGFSVFVNGVNAANPIVLSAQEAVSLLTVNVPKDFYNASEQGEVISPYSIHLTARSFFSTNEASYYSTTVDKWVALNVWGVNDKPQLSAAGQVPMQLIEGANPQPVVGTFKYSDVDVYDVISPSVYLATADYKNAAGQSIAAPNASFNGFLNVIATKDAGGANTGELLLTVNPNATVLDFLGDGETIAMRWGVSIDDGHGGSDTKFIDTVVRGVNDSPVASHLTMQAQTVEHLGSSASTMQLQGTFTFDDADINDSHTIEVIAPANAKGQLTAEKMLDSQGNLIGQVNWTYVVNSNAVEYLSAHQLLEQTFKVRVIDSKQTASETLIHIQIEGTGDVPTVSAIVDGGTLHEWEHLSDSSALRTSQGEVPFGDVDLLDTHTVTVDSAPAIYLNGIRVDPATEVGSVLSSKVEALIQNSVFDVSVDRDSTATGVGALKWQYQVPDTCLDFLSHGETLDIAYPLTIEGIMDSLRQTFQLTLKFIGENDAPHLISDPQVQLEVIDEVNGVPNGEVFTAFSELDFLDKDLADDFLIDIKPTPTQVTVGSLSAGEVIHPNAEGKVQLTYQVNASDIEFLAQDEVLTESFLVTLTDDSGAAIEQIVQATVVGSNDTPHWLESPQTDRIVIAEGTDISPIELQVSRPFEDVDVKDTAHQLTVSFVEATGQLTGATLTEAEYLQRIVHTSARNDVDQVNGDVTLDFAFQSTDFDYLAEGESLELTFQMVVSDEHFAQSESKTLTILVEGSNDQPFVIASATQITGAIAEADGAAGDIADYRGTVTLGDVDRSDVLQFQGVHSPSNAIGSISVPIADATLLADHSHAFEWKYQVAFSSLQFLAQDEKLTDTFTLLFSDGHGGQVGQEIAIELTGENDTPFVLDNESTVQASVVELTDLSPDEASLIHQSDGNIYFKDLDWQDSHALHYQAVDAGYVGVFTAAIESDSRQGEQGAVVWQFIVGDGDLDFLAEGEELNQQYVITVEDAHGAFVEKTVTVTLFGKDDAPIAKDTYATLPSLEKPFGFKLSDFSRAVQDPDSVIDSITIETLPDSEGVGGVGTLGLLTTGLTIEDTLVTDDGLLRYRLIAPGEEIRADEIDRLFFIPATDSVAPSFNYSVNADGVQSNQATFTLYSSLVLDEDSVKELMFDDFIHFLDASVEFQDEIFLDISSSSGGDLYVGSQKIEGKTSVTVQKTEGVFRFKDLIRFVPESNMSGVNAGSITFQMRDSMSGWIAGAIVMTVLPVLDAPIAPVFAADAPIYFEMGRSAHFVSIDANSADQGEFYDLVVELQQNGITAQYAFDQLPLNLPHQGPTQVSLDPALNLLMQEPGFAFAQPIHLSMSGSANDDKLSAHLVATGLTSDIMVLPNLELLSGDSQESIAYRAQIFGATDINPSIQPAGNDFSYFDQVMQVNDISFISPDYPEIVSTSQAFNGGYVSGENMNIYGTSGTDIILASENATNSLIDAAGGRDFIYGSSGNETFVLSEGFDAVMTGQGADVVVLAAEMSYESLSRQEMDSLLSLHLNKEEASLVTDSLETAFSGTHQLAGFIQDFDLANDDLVLAGFDNANYQTTDLDMTATGGKHLIAVTAQSNTGPAPDYISVLLDVTQSSIPFDAFNTEFIHKA